MSYRVTRHPEGGFTLHEGYRLVGWFDRETDARFVAGQMNGRSMRFGRAEEDRLDYRENSVTYLRKARMR